MEGSFPLSGIMFKSKSRQIALHTLCVLCVWCRNRVVIGRYRQRIRTKAVTFLSSHLPPSPSSSPYFFPASSSTNSLSCAAAVLGLFSPPRAVVAASPSWSTACCSLSRYSVKSVGTLPRATRRLAMVKIVSREQAETYIGQTKSRTSRGGWAWPQSARSTGALPSCTRACRPCWARSWRRHPERSPCPRH